MTGGLVRSLIDKWASDAADNRLPEAVTRFLDFPFSEIYSDYEPAPYSRIEQRLDDWLRNTTVDQDQRELFLLFMELFFVGRREFDALYRTAYRSVIQPWIVDDANIDILSASTASRISYEVEQTWFCPITDSLRINAFLKANGLKGHALRPDWRSLRQFGDIQKVESFMAAHNIARLVLLEDYIGSAVQSAETVEFAANSIGKRSLLVCPLVLSPDGDFALQKEAQKCKNLAIRPVLRIPANRHLSPTANADEPPNYPTLRQLIQRLAAAHKVVQERPFGFRQTGSLIVLYSNCPDNVPPVVHSSDDWAPLFPRVTR